MRVTLAASAAIATVAIPLGMAAGIGLTYANPFEPLDSFAVDAQAQSFAQAPTSVQTFAGHLMGDDNNDGVIAEDESGWDCVSMGNRICGPGNANGVPAGCFDEGGVLVAAWPCYVVVNPDGSSDVFTPDDRATGPASVDGATYVGGWN